MPAVNSRPIISAISTGTFICQRHKDTELNDTTWSAKSSLYEFRTHLDPGRKCGLQVAIQYSPCFETDHSLVIHCVVPCQGTRRRSVCYRFESVEKFMKVVCLRGLETTRCNGARVPTVALPTKISSRSPNAQQILRGCLLFVY
jgi:hypothetical protein